MTKRIPTCPECGSTKTWKDGIRYTNHGDIQRYICRKCGYRFSQTNWNRSKEHRVVQNVHRMPLNIPSDLLSNRQICVTETKAAKNLVEEVEPRTEAAQREGTTDHAEIKGKLFEFSWWMNKQGYAKATNRTYITCLRMLLKKGANLHDSESVKEALAKQKWSANRKRIAINSYTLFLKMEGLTWEKPRCKITRKIPFIPTEREINTLIAGSGKKTSTFLTLLKETAMRCGEAKKLQWIDLDSERRIITLNDPEKGSNPRAWKVSSELVGMLNNLPKKSKRLFGDGPMNSLKTTFLKTRKRLASKLKNPRLLRISFHTLRHWKATTLYHQTKDIYYVKEFLGHKSIKNTEIYITIERTLFAPSNDEFTVKVAKKPEEIKELLEVGFEYVCDKNELVFLRKRK
jgi:integrase/ribosomal protein S27AE